MVIMNSFISKILKVKVILFIPFFFFDFSKLLLLRITGVKIVFIDCSRIGGYYDLIWHKRSSQKNNLYFVLFAPNYKIANKFFHDILENEFSYKYKFYNYIFYKIFTKFKLNYSPLNLVPDNINKLKSIYANKKSKYYNFLRKLIIDNYNYQIKKINFPNSEFLYKKYNLKKNQYIAFHSRDKNYLNKIYPKRDWSYHDYRDSDIQTYVDAISKLYNKSSLKGIRIGKHVSKKVNNSSAILDYSNCNDYFDEGELSIIYNSKVFLVSDTGVSIFAEYVNKPKVYVNCTVPLRIHRWSRDSIFIFKKIFSIEKNKFLNIRDIINVNIYDKNFSKFYKVIDNTSDEIMNVLDEGLMRVDGEWQGSKEDTELQNKFWSLFGDYDYSRNKTFIGSSFLKNNDYLL